MLPDDAVCALTGLSAISFRRFLVLVLVGRLPSTASTVLVAVGATSSSWALLATAGLASVVVLAAAFACRGRLEDRLLKVPRRESGRGHEPESTSAGEDRQQTSPAAGARRPR